ncbi:MAG: maltose alpha-D-glucosyltransferase, partial [Caldilineaceae bacterium]|nr:maltose alpha-D-glucosyltransferase [Caldilineaceae bacterium]
DLVGALPLPPDAVADLMADGDTRWIHRGAYDLLGVAPEATGSHAGLPRARSLYGALPDQLRDPGSFASRLRHLLDLRRRYRIYESRQLAVPAVQAPGLLVMVHALPDGLGTEVTAINFGAGPVDEAVRLEGVGAGILQELLSGALLGEFEGTLHVELGPRQGKAYLIQ